MVKLDVKPELIVLTRRQVLYRTVAEISEKILPGTSLHEDIKKGILDREIIRSVSFYVKNDSDELVAEFTMEINWAEHAVKGISVDGSRFEVQKNQSIANQVLSVAGHISQLIDDVKKNFGSENIGYRMKYRPSIANDKNKYNEALEYMGHVRSSSKWADEDKDRDWDFELEYTPELLKELKISIRTVSPL
ncbi:MAG: hypothetical protein ACSHXB_10155 [Sulfitobacter sp.]